MDDLGAVLASSRPCGPRFFGCVLGSGEPVAAAADLVASVMNQNVWLAEAIGCPAFTGSLTGGGSMANLMGLAMARDAGRDACPPGCP